MLQFILGRAATGRTYSIMQRIKNDVVSGKEVVLLIPEQFSFECERQVLHTLGDMSAMRVEVLSFSRICDEVNRLAGGSAFSVMSDCDKIITMRLALKTVEKELKVWGRYVDSARFASIMVETIDELKTCAISPEQLSSISPIGTLGNKIDDIKQIYLTYDALIHNRFIDPTDNLTHLYNKLRDFKYFNNKEVYIDSFKDFTGQQYKILERIISQANNITVSLLSDGFDEDKPDILYNLRNVKRRISAIASKYNVECAEPVFFKESRYFSNELKILENSFFEDVESYEKTTKDISLCAADSVYDEAEFVARNIRKLVRTKGYRYRDFVIIARDTAEYENAILAACAKNDVSCFYDEKLPIENHPICIFAICALSASNKISSKDMFAYLKTELSPLSFSQINELENYVNMWNIDRNFWFEEWTMNPFGLKYDDVNSDNVKNTLDRINKIRKIALAPIVNLKNNFGDTAEQHATALLKLIEDCDVRSKLKERELQCCDDSDDFNAEFMRQGFDKYIQILDSIVKCLGTKNVSFSDFFDTLKLAIRHTSVGTIPQMLDQVTFGAADRIRPSRPKIAFVLGMNQGVFPKTPSSSGIFAAYERKQLIECGIELNDNTLEQAITENLLVYTSLCCPSDMLFISYISGASQNNEPASVIKRIKKCFPNINILCAKSDLLNENNIPETCAALFSAYCDSLSENSSITHELNTTLKKYPQLINKINKLSNKISCSDFSISANTAHLLYGDEIRTSASDFEVFHRCKFSHFCRYGLRLSKLQPATLDVLQRGTIVHYVLEKYIIGFSDKFKDISDEEISTIISDLVDEYFSLIPGIEQIKNARFKFIVEIITNSVIAVAKQVTKELAQSDFVPKKCELAIGNNGDIPAVDIKIDDKSAMKLIGKIDRVDVWNGYVRIIDYKTGTKAFKLSDVIFGLNLQMLIYMYALLKSPESNYFGMNPAGILYMPSSKKLGNDELCMNGLLLKDEEVLLAMEKENNGEFVPKIKFNKDGSIADTQSHVEKDVFKTVFDYITYLMQKMGREIKSGNISASPIDDSAKSACKYCDFASICHIEDTPHQKVEYVSNDEVISKMKGCVNNGI